MSLIGDLSDVPELKLAEPGEYDIRIERVKETKSKKNGRNGVILFCSFIGESNLKDLIHSIWFGNDGEYTGDDDDKSNLMWRMVKEFLLAIGLDGDGNLEKEDFIGIEFSALIEIEDDGEHEPKNVIKRVM